MVSLMPPNCNQTAKTCNVAQRRLKIVAALCGLCAFGAMISKDSGSSKYFVCCTVRLYRSNIVLVFELRHLRYFIAVAEELNFTRAAARLHTAQPSLSQQIRQLEGYVGTPLLRRDKHHVELTPAGQVMLAEAREILEKSRTAVRNALEAANKSTNQIAIGVNPSAEVKIIPTLLPIFEERFRDIRVVLHSLPTVEQIAGLRNRIIDIGFMRRSDENADLVTGTVLRESILIVLPAGNDLAKLERIPPDRLLPLPYISVVRVNGPNLYDIIESFCIESRVRFRTTQGSETVLGSINMVGANLGFALLPDYVRPILPKNVVARPLDCTNPPTIDLIYAYRKGELSASLRAFLTVLKEYILESQFQAPGALR
jgi:LysR family transcriptional regulator, hca operon transcriptional activator